MEKKAKNRKKQTAGQIRSEILKTIILMAIGIIMLAPFIWMISVSLERYANIEPPFPPKFIPETFSLLNYKIVLEGGLLIKAYLSSAIVAIGSVIIGLSSSLLAGYALSKGRFRGKSVILMVVLATMMIPLQARLIPMFLMFNDFGLINTYWPLFLPKLLYGFGIILSKQYFDTLPESLREAAKIDGAGEFFIFGRIFIPLSGPMIASATVLLFKNSWNDFLWPLVVLISDKYQTIPIYLTKFSRSDATRMAGLTMALASASVLPVILLFLVFQKYIIQSTALSGIKGE